MARTGQRHLGDRQHVRNPRPPWWRTARALENRGAIHDTVRRALGSAVGLDFFTKGASGELALSGPRYNNGMA